MVNPAKLYDWSPLKLSRDLAATIKAFIFLLRGSSAVRSQAEVAALREAASR
jgi:hypothetical protein